MKIAAMLRKIGVKSEVYPDNDKIKKQMSYADKKNIPYVAFVGDNEMAENTITLKNMLSGEQQSVTIDELINILSQECKSGRT
jgi:histidyl-tRNA synthetase